MRRGGVAPLAGAMLLAAAGSAVAQGPDLGQQIFMQYCATCHGDGGKGNGPMTEVMTVPVPDLTGLASRNDGEFPMLQVIHIIDGRTGLRGHGGKMPVFGDVFTAEVPGDMAPYTATFATRGRILALAQYLETIQQ